MISRPTPRAAIILRSAGGRAHLFWLLAAGLLLRCLISPGLVDQFYPYDLPGGSPLMKIAPGSYLIFLSALLASLQPPAANGPPVVWPAALFAAIAGIGVGWAVAMGNTTAIGAMFDLYLVAAAALFTLTRLDAAPLRRLFDLLAVVLGLNFLLLTAEFVLQRRLVYAAFATTGTQFRPGAMFEHPLLSGLIYAMAAPLAMKLRGPLAARLLLVMVCVAAVLISGARAASIVALAVLPVTLFAGVRRDGLQPALRQRLFWLQCIVVATVLPFIVVLALGNGLAYRFQSSLVDQSSLKRLQDLQLLGYLSSSQFWFGGAAGVGSVWSKQILGGDSIENPLVIGIFIYGLIFTSILLTLSVLAHVMLAWKGDLLVKLSLLSFFLIAGTNNFFMVKGWGLLFAVVLATTSGLMARRLVTPPNGLRTFGALRWARAAPRPGLRPGGGRA